MPNTSEKISSWEVWHRGEFLGIVETNYRWALEYWLNRRTVDGEAFKLKEVTHA